jgi:hypothetical protein
VNLVHATYTGTALSLVIFLAAGQPQRRSDARDRDSGLPGLDHGRVYLRRPVAGHHQALGRYQLLKLVEPVGLTAQRGQQSALVLAELVLGLDGGPQAFPGRA